MSRITPRLLLGLAAFGLLALPQSAPADDRSADEILAAIEAVEMPAIPDDRNDQAAVQQYIETRQKAMTEKAELIGALCKADPAHPKLPKLLPERWMAMVNMPSQQEALAEELDTLSADESSPLRTDASYFKAMFSAQAAMRDPSKLDETIELVESFIAIAPEDDRSASLLYQVAQYVRGIPDEQKKAMITRVVEEYPDSPTAAQVAGARRQTEAIGKPFELTFNEAITDKTISVQDDLKGKVVVIDFWATWCGPCIAEMPKMKQLYAEYKEKGVEFIGVSLDQPEDEGGLDALKTYVAENDIIWPQYYQGDGWQSEFSRSWGINAIPALFVIDQNGNLYSNQARGQLETMIPDLLEKGAPAGEE